MSSQFFFNLDAIKPEKNGGGGTLKYVTSKEVPGFVNIAFEALKLNQHAFQEPIWHPNAHKIGYCLQGNALVLMRTPNGQEVFSLEPGDIFFIPQGFVHSIVNFGKEETVINFALNHPLPQRMRFFQALLSLTDDVFAATFNTAPGFIDPLLKIAKHSGIIKTLPSGGKALPFISNRYKFNIEASGKPVQTKGGYLQLGLKGNLPVLEGLGILGFGLKPKGFVEPHWHTNGGELVYIVKGRTRITILAPDGKVEDLEVNGGQGAFAPASYFHHIANIGDEEVKVIAFFTHAEPDYMGFGEVLGFYPNQMLGSIFNVSPEYFDKLKKPSMPLVIVPI